MDVQVNDVLTMKKPHPCGSKQWRVLRTGMDFKLKCLGCGHELMLPAARRKEHPQDPDGGGKQVSNKHRLFAAILVVILVISMLASLIVPYLSLL